MLKARGDQAFLTVLCVADLAITAVCWVGAYFLRWRTGFVAPVNDTPPLLWCLQMLPTVAIAALVSYQLSGLYQLGKRWPLWQEIFHVLKATGFMLLTLVAATYFVRHPYESRLASVYFWAMTFLGLVILRRAIGVRLRMRRKRGQITGRALIVGTGRIARSVDRALRANNWLGIQPMGYVDDGSIHSTTPTVGSTADLHSLIEQHQIDYVFIALPLERYGEVKRIFRSLEKVLVEIRLVPDVPSIGATTVEVNDVEGLPVLSLRAAPHGYFDGVVKRGMDIALSTVGLIVLSPILATIAVIIKLHDRGPVFFLQERMGMNGHRFQMYKFRSMRVNAESATGPVWASKDDGRRTAFGSFLRATSLDELPQLLNVLIGDMSLVGPRPERPYFINTFRNTVPRYMMRHAVKAGITGWAQVNGWRGDTSLRKRVQYDLYYIANWSLWLDIRILFMTMFRVFHDRNAY